MFSFFSTYMCASPHVCTTSKTTHKNYIENKIIYFCDKCACVCLHSNILIGPMCDNTLSHHNTSRFSVIRAKMDGRTWIDRYQT